MFDSEGIDKMQVHPKVGIIWSPMPSTTVRLAAFRVLTQPFVAFQTIEPTQLAGFNQFFEDNPGSNSMRYGIGLDQRFSNNLFMGVELSWRDIDSAVDTNTDFEEKIDETLHRFYAYWTPTKAVALSAKYQFESFDREGLGGTNDPDKLRTHFVPFGLNYYHPNGFSRNLLRHMLIKRLSLRKILVQMWRMTISGWLIYLWGIDYQSAMVCLVFLLTIYWIKILFSKASLIWRKRGCLNFNQIDHSLRV